MEWALFQTIFDNVGPPLLGAVNGIIAALQGWARPWFTAAVALLIIGRSTYASLAKPNSYPMNEAFADAVVGGLLAYVACSTAGLGPMARELVLNGLSRELGQAVVGSIGARTLSPALFDEALNRGFVAGLDAFSNLPWSPKGMALGVLITLVYWPVVALCVGVAFLVWLSAFVMTAVCVSLWPLGVIMFAFPWFRGMAWGWARTTLANVLLQVLVTIVMTISLAAMGRVLGNLYATVGAGGTTNEIREIRTLIGGLIIVGYLAWIARQLPGLAATMAHGFTGFGQVRFAPTLPNSSPSPTAPNAGGPHQQADQQSPGSGHAPGAMPQGMPPGRALG